MSHNFETAVANGAQMLDTVAPGWHRLIDLPTLRLDSCERCVCGQLGMALGWNLFPDMDDFPHEYGFDIPNDWADEESVSELTLDEQLVYEQGLYRSLDREWHKAIMARLDLDRRPAPHEIQVESQEEAIA